MQSHTGALADESWVYDLAFRERGIIAASDVDDLLDRAQLFVQLPRERHRRKAAHRCHHHLGWRRRPRHRHRRRRGNAASPALPEIEAWVRERVPGDTVNPLDLTGFVMTRTELMEEVFTAYAGAVDVLVLAWWAGGDDEGWSRTMLDPFAKVAARADVPFLVSPVEATAVGDWVVDWRRRRPPLRPRAALRLPGRRRPRSLRRGRGARRPTCGRPALVAASLVGSGAGPMVRFADAMELLADIGVDIARGRCCRTGRSTTRRSPGWVSRSWSSSPTCRTAPSSMPCASACRGPSSRPWSASCGRSRPLTTCLARSPCSRWSSGHAEAFAGLNARTSLGPVAPVRPGRRARRGRAPGQRPLAAAGRGRPRWRWQPRSAGPGVVGRRRGQPPWPLDAVVQVHARSRSPVDACTARGWLRST